MIAPIWTFLRSPVGIAVVLILGAYLYGHHAGRTGADARWQARYDTAVAEWRQKVAVADAANAAQHAADEAHLAELQKEIADYEQGRNSPDWVFTPADEAHYRKLLPAR